ncbi:MAG: segregation/condensation protein A [Erysipelotrichaceae bacterium]|nr:segregation/condensation protein A [Erysipelotrichaceae bacterium]
MDFKVTIDQFDGPLDLMLHLIKEGELDLFALDIVKLTDQYLRYIHAMQDLHLDIASEYMLELATLIEYKSKKLLPNEKEELEDDYEDESEQLVRRLIEYQRYKEITDDFLNLYHERSLMHDKPMSEIAGEWVKIDENFEETSPYELIKAMEKCLKRLQLAEPYEVNYQTQQISVEDRVEFIREKIAHWPETFTMDQTMEDCTSVYMVVVNFLALLDMVHDGMLTFTVSGDGEQVFFTKGISYE